MASGLTANVNGIVLHYIDHVGDAAVDAVALHGFAGRQHCRLLFDHLLHDRALKLRGQRCPSSIMKDREQCD